MNAPKLQILVRQKFCAHEFSLDDLSRTDISLPPKPKKGSGYHAFAEWWKECCTGECHTKRVKWPCRKCGKIFYAHCGLDISPKYGRTVYSANNYIYANKEIES